MRSGVRLVIWGMLGGACIAGLSSCGRPADYFPLNPGNRWVYEYTVEDRTLEAVRVVADERESDGHRVYAVDLALPSTGIGRRELWSSKDDVVSMLVTSPAFPNTYDAVPVIAAPAKVGDIREYRSRAAFLPGTELVIHSKIVGIEWLDLPVGRVRAVHVKYTVKVVQAKPLREQLMDTREYWFTKHIGIVQERMTVYEHSVLLRLKQFVTQ